MGKTLGAFRSQHLMTRTLKKTRVFNPILIDWRTKKYSRARIARMIVSEALSILVGLHGSCRDLRADVPSPTSMKLPSR